MTDDVPFVDLRAERTVLSACLFEPEESLDTAREMLSPGDFFHGDHRRIFEACCELRDAGEAIDHVTVYHRLREHGGLAEGPALISEIMHTTPATAYLGDHCRIVRDNSRLRLASALGSRIFHETRTQPAAERDVQKMLENFERELSQLTHERSESTLRPVAEVLQDMTRSFRDPEGHGRIETGFPEVDSQTGGLFAGTLRILAARPGMGKTAYALAECVRIAERNVAVAFFSLEMPARDIAMRLVAMEGDVDLQRLRVAKIDQWEWTRVADASAKLAKLPIYIDESPSLSAWEVRGRVAKLQRRIEERVVVYVDYLQLMRGQRDKNSNREQEIASLTRDMKHIAKELDVPVTLLAQLSRRVEERRDRIPILSDLRESGAAEQDADVVGFLFRPAYYAHLEDDSDEAQLIIAKQRNGPTGTVRLSFVGPSVRFEGRQADHWDGFQDEPPPGYVD